MNKIRIILVDDHTVYLHNTLHNLEPIAYVGNIF